MKAPGEAIYYKGRGLCQWRMGNLEEAIFDFKETVRIEPFNLTYRIELCDALTELGRYEEAKGCKSIIINLLSA